MPDDMQERIRSNTNKYFESLALIIIQVCKVWRRVWYALCFLL
jgi:hypothetical protein